MYKIFVDKIYDEFSSFPETPDEALECVDQSGYL